MRKIKVFNLIMSLLILMGGIAFLVASRINFAIKPVYVKSVASALFVFTGLVNLIYVLKHRTFNKKFAICLFIGLIFAFLGDVLLEIVFIVGAALFALGHVFFFISYCFLAKFNWKDLLLAALIFIPSLLIILFVPIFKFQGIFKIVCIVYALVISFMVGKSLGNYLRVKTKGNLIVLIGSFLFFFSDMMLLFSIFGGIRLCNIFCLLTYYPAEFFLAYSILKNK